MLGLGWSSVVRWRRRFATALGVTAGLASCVIEVGGPPATELYRLIDAHCERATACGCDWTLPADDACTEELEARWKARLSEAQARALRYDAACFAAITAQIEEHRCERPGGERPLCESFCAPFHGDRAEGEPCSGDDALVSDCAQGLVCAGGTCASPCLALGGRQRGERCGNDLVGTYDDCAGSLWCNHVGICEERAGAGEPCAGDQCAEGLACDWNSLTCVPRPGAGEPCEGSCADGLFCDYRSGVCRRASGEGERCTELPCADDLYCQPTNDGWDAFCRSYAAEGEDCSQRPCGDRLYCDDADRCVAAPGEGRPCLFGVLCADGVVCEPQTTRCVAPPEEGRACIQGECAPGTFCDVAMDPTGVGICTARRANDEPCSGHRQCQSGYCPNGYCWPIPLEGDDCRGTDACAGGLVCNGTTCERTLTRAPAACSHPGW